VGVEITTSLGLKINNVLKQKQKNKKTTKNKKPKPKDMMS